MKHLQVCQFGDKSIGKMTVGEFQGPKETVNIGGPPPVTERPPPVRLYQAMQATCLQQLPAKLTNHFFYFLRHQIPPQWKSCGASAVPGPEVPVKILEHTVETAASDEERSDAVEKLRTLHKNRDFMRSVVHSLVDVVTNGDNELNDAVFTDNVSLTK